MKSAYLLGLVLLLFAGGLKAQNLLELTKGQKFIAGGFHLGGHRSSYRSDFTYVNIDRNSYLYVYSSGGYLLNAQTALLIGTSYSHELDKGTGRIDIFQEYNDKNEEVYVRRYGIVENKSYSIGLSTGLRRYWWLNDRFYGALTLGLSGNYYLSKWEEPQLGQNSSGGNWRQWSMNLSAKPGAMYLLSKRFGLEAELVGFGLSYASKSGPYYAPTLTTQLTAGEWLSLGLVYFLR